MDGLVVPGPLAVHPVVPASSCDHSVVCDPPVDVPVVINVTAEVLVFLCYSS